MEYIKVKEAAEKWGLSDRRVRILCEQNRIDGVIKEGHTYLIPADAIKPVDRRSLRNVEIRPGFSAHFHKIDALKEELNRRRPLTKGEFKRLHEDFLIEYTYSSNAIEGNTLTLKETAIVLKGITIDKKPLKDHLEAVGHRDAFLYITQLVTNKVSFTESIIKQVHSLVLMDKPEDKGVYRRIPVRVMGAAHEPPQPYLVPMQMEQLVAEFSKTKLHPIESAALFHLKFEGIHPFIDGNGRTGRLLLNLILMQNGYPPINVKFADRKRYYNCFDAYYKDNDPDQMIQMIAEYVEERLKAYIGILNPDT
ncbi:MAG: Fic family protein [Desulfitobacteriaceae bacterium]